jgi:Tol biopolymer transport system component
LGDSAQAPQFIQTVSGEGYRFVGRLSSEAHPAGRSFDTDDPPRIAAPTRGTGRQSRHWSRRRLRIVDVAVAAALVLIVGWASLGYLATDAPPPATPADPNAVRPPQIIPMTSSPEVAEFQPALSPDGRWLAFTRPRADGGPLDLWVKQVDGGEAVRLSSGEGSTYTPAWSPESDRVAFVRHVPGTDQDLISSVSPVGGDERQHCTLSRVGRQYSALSWSPNGGVLALAMRQPADGPMRIYLLTIGTCETEPLTNPPDDTPGDAYPRFSPDGERIAFRRDERLPTLDHLLVVPVSGGEPTPVVSDFFQIYGMDWAADGRSIIYSDFRPGQSGTWGLWKIRVDDGGEPEPVGISEGARYPTVARLARRLAYRSMDSRMDAWRVPGPASTAPEATGQALCSSNRYEYHPEYSSDGRKIALISHRSGKAEVWTCNADGSNLRQITFTDDLVEMPRWSPDGTQLTYSGRDPETGTYDIWIVRETGGDARRVTDHRADERGPNWSRDARTIYFSSDRTGRHEVWRQRLEDGQPVGDPARLTKNGGEWPRESFDGKYVYFTRPAENGQILRGIWRIPVDGDDEQRLTDNGAGNNWALLQKELLYEVLPRGGPKVFELYDIATGNIETVAHGAPSPYGNIYLGTSVSPDRQWFLYTSGSSTSDINLMDNFR